MSNERVLLCGGVDYSGKKYGEKPPIKLKLQEKDNNINFKIGDINKKMFMDVPDILFDLLEIAAYVFCADQAITRGGDGASNMGENWRRKLHFFIPVRNPDKWNSREVSSALHDTLNFLSDDEYYFNFEKLHDPPSRQEYFENCEGGGIKADEVILFSGGLDSLGGAVNEIITNKKATALVSHRSSFKISNRMESLVNDLFSYCQKDRLLHIPVLLQKDRNLTKDNTQRSRSFLYASLGATVARMFKLSRIRMYENGIISLNLPISSQLIGARATRTTHPKTLAGFSRLFSALIGEQFQVENPFLLKTKAEVIKVVEEAGCGDLIRHTVSCSRVIHSTQMHPHCGNCLQCIDRRFGIMAAGCEKYDPSEMYGVDLLKGERKPGESKTLAESYVRTAMEIKDMSDEMFFSHFTEVSRALSCMDGTIDENARRILNLFRRHSEGIDKVLEKAFKKNAANIREGNLPPSCIIIMSLPEKYRKQSMDSEDFVYSSDFRSVTLKGENFSLTPAQARIIEVLHRDHENGILEVGQEYLLEQTDSTSQKIKDIFKRSSAWGHLIVKGTSKGSYRLNL